jgi:hypothetical protein
VFIEHNNCLIVQADDLDTLASIGNGLEFRQSGIPDSGDGLFATRVFSKGVAVTWYDGDLLFVLKVLGKKNPKIMGEWSHWRSVPEHDFVVRGIRRDFGAFKGRGGASMANHDPSRQNCTLKNSTKCISMFCGDDFQWWQVRVMLLVAMQDILVGDELFTDYGVSSTAPQEIRVDAFR